MKADEEVRQLHYTLGWRPKKNHLFGTIVGTHILELQKVEIFRY